MDLKLKLARGKKANLIQIVTAIIAKP
jgi:hypothetical protein